MESECGEYRRDHSGLYQLKVNGIGEEMWVLVCAHYKLPSDVKKAMQFYWDMSND